MGAGYGRYGQALALALARGVMGFRNARLIDAHFAIVLFRSYLMLDNSNPTAVSALGRLKEVNGRSGARTAPIDAYRNDAINLIDLPYFVRHLLQPPRARTAAHGCGALPPTGLFCLSWCWYCMGSEASGLGVLCSVDHAPHAREPRYSRTTGASDGPL